MKRFTFILSILFLVPILLNAQNTTSTPPDKAKIEFTAEYIYAAKMYSEGFGDGFTFGLAFPIFKDRFKLRVSYGQKNLRFNLSNNPCAATNFADAQSDTYASLSENTNGFGSSLNTYTLINQANVQILCP